MPDTSSSSSPDNILLQKFRPAPVKEVFTGPRPSWGLADLGDLARIRTTPYGRVELIATFDHLFLDGTYPEKQAALYLDVAARVRSLAELIWPELAGKLELPEETKKEDGE